MSSASTAKGAPAEATEVHTRILRCMLATEDCYAYWRRVDTRVPITKRTAIAFEERWFGLKSEARVRTLMTDMRERFDAFPESLALFHDLERVPPSLRASLCHVHTQLADPVYRAFTGDFLPARRREGRTTIDRPAVARWIETIAPGRWSTVTCVKFASNLLATALDAGLVQGRAAVRALALGPLDPAVVGYVLYLLRDVRVEGTLTDNSYLRSLGVEHSSLRLLAPSLPGIRIAAIGDLLDVSFSERSLSAWGIRYLGDNH